VPGRPVAPILNSVNTTTISVTVARSPDDGGGEISRHEIWRNQGTGTLDFVNVTTYDGLQATHTVTVAADGLTAG